MYQLIINVVTFSLNAHIWFRIKQRVWNKVKCNSGCVMLDWTAWYGLIADAMYIELQHLRPVQWSPPIRPHKCSKLSRWMAGRFQRFYLERTISDIHVDIDSVTNRWLIFDIIYYYIYINRSQLRIKYVSTFPLIHLWLVLTFMGAMGVVSVNVKTYHKCINAKSCNKYSDS